MDDEDYQALIAIVAEELRKSGAANIAAERHYMRVNVETGEARLLEPQSRLIEMLKAFDRFLAIQDQNTYLIALSSIKESLKGEGPERATVELATDGMPREIDLSETPDLTVVRRNLRELIVRLLDPSPRPGGEFA